MLPFQKQDYLQNSPIADYMDNIWNNFVEIAIDLEDTHMVIR